MRKGWTPGSWRVAGQSEGGRYITVKADGGRVVARVPWNTDRQMAELQDATDAADAQLVAAAPMLAEVVQEALDFASLATMMAPGHRKRAADRLSRRCLLALSALEPEGRV